MALRFKQRGSTIELHVQKKDANALTNSEEPDQTVLLGAAEEQSGLGLPCLQIRLLLFKCSSLKSTLRTCSVG